MAKIKIISNPYQKETVFQNWDEVSDHFKLFSSARFLYIDGKVVLCPFSN